MDTVVKEYHLRNPEKDAMTYINALKREAKGHLLEALGSQGAVYSHLIEQNTKGKIRAWYNATGNLIGLLMFDIGKLWWTDKVVVMEESVFCIDTSYSGIQREAIKELERVARGYEAELIISGNVLSTVKTERLVLNGYKKAGFQPICTDMVKVVAYE